MVIPQGGKLQKYYEIFMRPSTKKLGDPRPDLKYTIRLVNFMPPTPPPSIAYSPESCSSDDDSDLEEEEEELEDFVDFQNEAKREKYALRIQAMLAKQKQDIQSHLARKMKRKFSLKKMIITTKIRKPKARRNDSEDAQNKKVEPKESFGKALKQAERQNALSKKLKLVGMRFKKQNRK